MGPPLEKSAWFRSIADKRQVSLGLCKPFLRLEEAFVFGRETGCREDGHKLAITAAPGFLARLEVGLVATPSP